MLKLLDEWLFPPRCAVCEAEIAADRWFCEGCTQGIAPLGVACPKCSEPQEAAVPTVCRRCIKEPLPLYIVAPWRYGGAIADALRAFKYGDKSFAGRAVGMLSAPFLQSAITLADIDWIVPVPLHWWRRARRGFDQAAVLSGWAIGGEARKKLAPQALERRRQTAEQASLSRSDRRDNVRGAFAVTRRWQPRIAHRNILLIDDVATTGATLAAAATACLAAGARSVLGFAFARAER